MKIELPSADHRLLLYDHGGKRVEMADAGMWFAPECPFPTAQRNEWSDLFGYISEVHGREAGVRAMCVPFVKMLNVWPGHPIGTAMLRRRWGIPEIAWVTVAKNYRGHGLGYQMVQNLLQCCNTRYVCAVTSDPSVVPFWEKCGFHVAEEIPDA